MARSDNSPVMRILALPAPAALQLRALVASDGLGRGPNGAKAPGHRAPPSLSDRAWGSLGDLWSRSRPLVSRSRQALAVKDL